MTPEAIRARVVEVALSCVGLGAYDPEPYADLIGPDEAPEMRRAMLSMYGCGLVTAGIWRRAGLVACSELAAPYKSQNALSRLEKLARRLSAWRTYPQGALPRLGDAVFLVGPEHVFTVASEPTKIDLEVRFASVDGGQLDDSCRVGEVPDSFSLACAHGTKGCLRHHPDPLEIIRARQRIWRAGKDQARDDQPGAAAGRVRAIRGWVDVSLLPFRTAEQEVYET